MRDFLRNLRLPGSKPRAYRGRLGGGPIGRGRPAPRRAYAVTRVEAPRPKREWNIPWRRIGLVTGSVASVAGMLYGVAWLVTGDTLRVREIDITGAQIVDPHVVAFVSSVGGDSMLTVDIESAGDAIEAIPGVKSATVERTWPHGIRIAIVEHQAWGYWQAAGRIYTIDRDGAVLQASRPASKNAPTIIDLASPRNLAEGDVSDPDTVRLVARLLDDGVLRGLNPSAFLFERDRGLTVVADEGPDAVFGDSSNYEFKVQAFEAVLRQLQDENAGPPQVAEVDLRFGRNVVLR